MTLTMEKPYERIDGSTHIINEMVIMKTNEK